jgi:hypothetical protein
MTQPKITLGPKLAMVRFDLQSPRVREIFRNARFNVLVPNRPLTAEEARKRVRHP